VLFAVGRVTEQDDVKDGMTWLKTEVPATGTSASPPPSPSSVNWAESIPITGGGVHNATLGSSPRTRWSDAWGFVLGP
jgi:hypothetical protein